MIITNLAGSTVEHLTDVQVINRKRRVNGAHQLTFRTIKTPKNAAYDLIQEESTIDFLNLPYRIKKVNETSIGEYVIKTVEAHHTFFDTIDNHIYTKLNGSQSILNAANFVFAGTSYVINVVDSLDNVTFSDFGDDNTLSLFLKLLEHYGAEFEVSGSTITIKKQIGNSLDYQFRYKANLKVLNKDGNTDNLATYIKGFGKQNEDGTYAATAEYTSPNASIYGVRHAPPVYDERFTDNTSLLNYIKTKLQDVPNVSFTVDSATLNFSPGLGDSVYVIHEPMGVDVNARVMEIGEQLTIDGVVLKAQVTIANFSNNVSDKLAGYGSAQKEYGKAFDDNGGLKYDRLAIAVREATEALQSAQTQLEFANGIIGRDPDNPNNLTIFTSNGIGVSTDGGATFREAITHLGVNTSALTAGQINANNISLKGGTADKYTLIDSNGLYAKAGAVKIERPDGYTVINDGIVQHGFNLFGAYPAFRTGGAYEQAGWVMVATTNRFETIQSYTFKHQSRYILVAFGLRTDNGIIGYMSFDLSEWDGSGGLGNLGTSTNSGPDTEGVYTYLLDLGAPTGLLKRLNIRLYGSDANWGVYGRILYISQEG